MKGLLTGDGDMNAERAGLSDIDALVEMRLAYLAEDFGGLDEADSAAIRERLPGYFREHLNRDLFCYAVRDEGGIAACALLLVVEKPMSPSFLNGKTGTVMNVYTKPPFRRRGYGKAVVQALLADAGAMGLCRVDLKATDDGYRLYRSVGFEDDASHYRAMKRML